MLEVPAFTLVADTRGGLSGITASASRSLLGSSWTKSGLRLSWRGLRKAQRTENFGKTLKEISARVGGEISQDVPTCTQGTLSNIITRESEQTWLKVGPQREGGEGDKYFLEEGKYLQFAWVQAE